MSSKDKGRFARWAQRKEAARQRRGGAAPAIPEESAAAPATAPAPEGAAKSESEDAAGQPAPDLDLPDVETLTAGSDFTAFMKDGVPAGVRRLALRKLWASDPMFNVIDEMVEYGEDYTDAAMVVEGMKSAWEAGRGYAKKAVEQSGDEADAQDDAEDREPVAPEEVSADERPPEDDGKEHG